MQPPSSRQFVRVVTPLQAEEATWQALELGAAMAKELRAELRALFLTDANALAAAALPMTRTISYQTGAIGSFDVELLETAYRVRASRARERVAELCRREALQWSFDIAERLDANSSAGPGAAASVAERYDLLLLDARNLSVPSQCLPLLELLTHHTLIGLWDRQAQKPDHIVLISHGNRGALLVAAAIARTFDVALEVYVCGGSTDERAAISSMIKGFLDDQNMVAEIRDLNLDSESRRRELLQENRNALLVLDGPEIAQAVLI